MVKFLLYHLFALAVCILYTEAESDSIRLVSTEVNDFNGQKGIVQMRDNFTWSFINGSDWNLPNAIVTCRNLGFRGLASYDTASMDYNDAPFIINSLQCSGKEKQLRECSTSKQTDELRPDSASPVNVATVSCSGVSSVRLVGGNGIHEGWVMVLYNDSWGSVCDDYWGENDTHVLCKQLGYPGKGGSVLSSEEATSSLMRPSLDEDKNQIWIDDSNCTMEDFDIRLCKKDDWGPIKSCDFSEDVAVRCEVPQICPVLPVVGLAETAPSVVNSLFEPGTTVDFFCNNSTRYTKNINIACQSDGIWSENPPLCMPSFNGIKCADLPTMLNGVVVTDDISSKVLQFKCNNGYNLLGPNEIHCIDGMWDNVPPTCLPSRGGSERCFLPKYVWHSKVVMSINTNSVQINESVRFTCRHKSEVLIGYSQITCIKRGEWSEWNGPVPMCMQTSSKSTISASSPWSTSDNVNVSTICGAVIGALAICLLVGMVVIFGIIAINLSQRKRSTHVENQVHNNLSSPLIDPFSDGKEM